MKNTCAHHWKIETPNGPASSGHCIRCGDTRLFANFDPRDATDPGGWKAHFHKMEAAELGVTRKRPGNAL